MNPLDTLDLLEREATVGPWSADPDLADYDAGLHNVWHPIDPKRAGGLAAVAHDIFSLNDAALIALSRNHLRALIDVARAAQARIENEIEATHYHIHDPFCPHCIAAQAEQIALVPLLIEEEEAEDVARKVAAL